MPRKRFTEFSTGRWRDLLRYWVMALPFCVAINPAMAAGSSASGATPAVAANGGAAVSVEDLLASAQAGDPWAQLNLGAAFDRGMAGLPLDPVRAVVWYRRAAEAGLAEAQFNLAHSLATGSGVPRDDAEGLHWMQRAAAQDLPSAQYLTGVMYAEGLGTAPDIAQAIAWLERAASNGNDDAARLLLRLQSPD